jgi:dihydropteroate synthase
VTSTVLENLASNRAFAMRILSVMPDSFSDGGIFSCIEDAVAHGLEKSKLDADVIDLGGEPARSYATPLGADEELERGLPMVKGPANASGINHYDAMPSLVAKHKVPSGLTHSRGAHCGGGTNPVQAFRIIVGGATLHRSHFNSVRQKRTAL